MFFLGINPKLTLRKALKEKIDDIITWLDLDDDDTKLLMKETKTGDNTTQEIVIPALTHTIRYSDQETVRIGSQLPSTKLELHRLTSQHSRASFVKRPT